MAVPVAPVSLSPQSRPRPPEHVARAFLHELLDFHLRVTDILGSHVSLDNQSFMASFVASLGKQSSARECIHDLALGKFAQLTAFVSVLTGVDPQLPAMSSPHTPDSSVQPHTTAPSNAHSPTTRASLTAQRSEDRPSTAPTYATMVRRSLPLKSPVHPSKLPSLHDFPQQDDSFNMEFFTLSRKGVRQYYRTAIAACGHEEKTFVLLKTANNAPIIKNPLHLTGILAKGGIRDPLTIIKTPNPCQFLVFGPKSSLSLVQASYDRFRKLLLRQSSFQRLPAVDVQPVPGLLDLCPAKAQQTYFNSQTHSDMKYSALRMITLNGALVAFSQHPSATMTESVMML